MEKVLKLYKNLGETPLECLERFRVENSEYNGVPMTYAGRLDPMAEGLLIVLTGDECKKKDEYLGLDKEYIFEVLFGVQTDTYDILGIPRLPNIRDREKMVMGSEGSFVGRHTQKYPAYSSKTVDGKPLFQMARDGVDFEAPTKEIEIFSLDKLEEHFISAKDVLIEIQHRINLVQGDFRQEEILDAWQNLLKSDPSKNFKIQKFKINCSSGTYVRSIANEMGGIAYSIKRTRVGEYTLTKL